VAATRPNTSQMTEGATESNDDSKASLIGTFVAFLSTKRLVSKLQKPRVTTKLPLLPKLGKRDLCCISMSRLAG
jgi:hypothetical protein